jgi:hypothetical protein
MALAVCTATPAQGPGKLLDACDIVLTHGGREFLGGNPEVLSREPTRSCQLTDPASGVVMFILRTGITRATFDGDVAKMRRNPAYSLKEEPEFGANVFSSSVANTNAIVFMALKGDRVVVLQILSLHPDPTAMRRFFKRLLAGA